MRNNPQPTDLAILNKYPGGGRVPHPQQLLEQLLQTIPEDKDQYSQQIQQHVTDASKCGTDPGDNISGSHSAVLALQFIKTFESDQWVQLASLHFYPDGQQRHQEDIKVHGLCFHVV